MGGLGSGRSSMGSLVEHAVTIDLQSMIRCGQVHDGHRGRLGMRVRYTGEFIRVFYDLRDPDDASLELNYRQFIGADVQPEVAQTFRLTFTVPHFGGRRWWMICPCDGRRVAKLYKPIAGNTFACREEWGLVYESQRQGSVDRTFARLDRIQRSFERRQRKGDGGRR